MARKHHLLFFAVFLLLFSAARSAYGEVFVTFPTREIKGSLSYLPFSLVLTYDYADKGVQSNVIPTTKTKPRWNVGYESFQFPTNEVDLYTVYLTLRYSAVANHTVWIYIYSAGIECEKEPLSLYASTISFVFKIQTSLAPNPEEIQKRQENLVITKNQELMTEVTNFRRDMKEMIEQRLVPIIVVLALISAANLALTLRRRGG